MSLSENEVQPLLEFICRRTGLIFPDMRARDVREAIERARVRVGVGTGPRLLAVLEADTAALDELVADLTIGETYFFRDPAQFKVLREQILPEVKRAGAPIRAWSAACATGEEAYSLAILFAEENVGPETRVMGTDISRPRLERARQGKYGAWSLRGLSEERIDGLFERAGKNVIVREDYRDRVDFGYLNLAQDSYPAISTGVWAMDIILCRNVLIYFDDATVRSVAEKLVQTLSDDGFLLLGASDPPITDMVDCETTVTEAGLLYRRRRRHAVSAPVRAVPQPAAETKFKAEPTRKAVPQPARVKQVAASLVVGPALVRELANEGRVAEALTAVNEALTQQPNTAELFYLQGVLLSEQRQFEDAASSARRALYLDRELAVAHMLLANMQNRLGEISAARRSMRNARDVLARMQPEEQVPSADGETAGRLAEMVRMQLEFLENVA